MKKLVIYLLKISFSLYICTTCINSQTPTEPEIRDNIGLHISVLPGNYMFKSDRIKSNISRVIDAEWINESFGIHAAISYYSMDVFMKDVYIITEYFGPVIYGKIWHVFADSYEEIKYNCFEIGVSFPMLYDKSEQLYVQFDLGWSFGDDKIEKEDYFMDGNGVIRKGTIKLKVKSNVVIPIISVNYRRFLYKNAAIMLKLKYSHINNMFERMHLSTKNLLYLYLGLSYNIR